MIDLANAGYLWQIMIIQDANNEQGNIFNKYFFSSKFYIFDSLVAEDVNVKVVANINNMQYICIQYI